MRSDIEVGFKHQIPWAKERCLYSRWSVEDTVRILAEIESNYRIG